ncbi:hypothetical protein FC695_04735 [Bacillus cereus]|uniref:Uncharacterized protein n=1 Tax=Bacillus cereus TaxID=1396 RepID=A0A9X9AE22_BACCE|nr:YopX family protein [Bacillus cereus]MCM3222908.1 YopX family protein [Bacillus cereus]MEC3336045.1 YopX family protein [Bacillus cereus]TKH20651.1 hypothetical protein FC692_28490 [Bacillus cereus]TKJ07026.1 hypothetical protein FC695_04735 [Bacillus cereus]
MEEINYQVFTEDKEGVTQLFDVVAVYCDKEDTDGNMVIFKNSFGNSECKIVNKIKLRQYTGLKDKNKTRIYEGDFVKYWNKILGENECEVIFFNLGGFGTSDCWLSDIGECEVIGNIYENPGLLNASKIE